MEADKVDSIRVLTRQMDDLLVNPWQESASQRSPTLPPYLVIVDALDEISAGGGSGFLARLLATVKSGDLKGLRFLVTSRPDPDLVAQFHTHLENDSVFHLESVEKIQVGNDISTYLKSKLGNLGDSEIAAISKLSDGLFIYASTAVRFIAPKNPVREQRKQLQKLLETKIPVSSRKDISPVDKVYQQVLTTALGVDENLLPARLIVLHSILCAKEPLTLAIIATLHSTDDIDEEIACMVVEDLNAVLYVKEDRIFWYHASFQDFMFDEVRSRLAMDSIDTRSEPRILDVYCNQIDVHTLLALRCFAVMKSSLRFNICHLPSSFLLDSEVPNLEDLIEQNISLDLLYASRYWCAHLLESRSDDNIYDSISDFVLHRALFWLELMNVLLYTAQCSPDLRKAQAFIAEVRSY